MQSTARLSGFHTPVETITPPMGLRCKTLITPIALARPPPCSKKFKHIIDICQVQCALMRQLLLAQKNMTNMRHGGQPFAYGVLRRVWLYPDVCRNFSYPVQLRFVVLQGHFRLCTLIGELEFFP